MADFELTQVDTGGVALRDEKWRDEVLNFASADDFPAGTIFARHSGTGKLQIYAVGGSSNGNGTPRCVLTYAVSKDASGDVPVRVLVAGVVNKNRLIVDADGDASNITGAVLDLLCQTGIVAEDVTQLPQAEPELS